MIDGVVRIVVVLPPLVVLHHHLVVVQMALPSAEFTLPNAHRSAHKPQGRKTWRLPASFAGHKGLPHRDAIAGHCHRQVEQTNISGGGSDLPLVLSCRCLPIAFHPGTQCIWPMHQKGGGGGGGGSESSAAVILNKLPLLPTSEGCICVLLQLRLLMAISKPASSLLGQHWLGGVHPDFKWLGPRLSRGKEKGLRGGRLLELLAHTPLEAQS